MNNIKYYSQIEMNAPPIEEKHIVTKQYLDEALKDLDPSTVIPELTIVDSDNNKFELQKELQFIGAQVSQAEDKKIIVEIEGQPKEYIIADENNKESTLIKRLKFIGGNISTTADTIIVDTSRNITFPNMAKVFEFTGDGETLQYIFSHNLNSKNIICSLYNLDTGMDILVNTVRLNENDVKLSLDVPIEKDTKIVLVIYNATPEGEISTEEPFKVWGIRIDTTDSNPATCCKYIETLDPPPDDFGERPCLMKDGVVNYYLDPNDFTKKSDGSSADIISGNDGDVMIEIPKMAFFITNVGDFTEVRLTNHSNAQVLDSRYRYLGHTRDMDGDRTKLYIGAYQGCEISSKLRSLSSKTPLATNTITQFRTKAQANGAGYSLTAFHNVTLLQVMYLIKYGHLNSQIILGQGVSSGTVPIITGGTEQRGMYYGTQDTREHVKFAGIEDWYGNVWDRIDGCCIGADYTLYTATNNFSDTNTGVGYKNQGKWLTVSFARVYMKQVYGDTEKGFLPISSTAGSSTTYYCDEIHWGSSSVGGLSGGGYNDGAGTGIFGLHLALPVSFSGANTGARLMFL